jgi:hypothetical protein
MRKRVYSALGLSMVLCMLVPMSGFGQREAAALPSDDPEVYHSFFFFMENFGQWLDARALQVPAKRANLMASAARYLKVDVSELPKLVAHCRSVSATLRQIDAEALQYWTAQPGEGKAPDNAILRQFAARRQDAIQAGTQQLAQVLSPASWSGVHTHINGAHRSSIQIQK